MVDTPHTKDALRNLLRQRRNALSRTQQDTAARALVSSVTKLPTWTEARHVAIYLAQDGEIQTGSLESAARERGMQVYLPVITDMDSLQFACWDCSVDLVNNRYGIPEPPSAVPRRAPTDLDIIFVPLVGWDNDCNRLGMGGGYYDRALSNQPTALLVGLAHECQSVEKLPSDSWDVPLDYIATDAALYRSRREKVEGRGVIRRR